MIRGARFTRLAAAAAALLATSALATPGGVVFWDMSQKPPTFRILKDGKLSEPATGVADARGPNGEPPLGTIYYDGTQQLRVTTPYREGTDEHTAAKESIREAIAAYNVRQVPKPTVRRDADMVIVSPRFDQRTGLIVGKDFKGPTYEGFGYLQRPDLSWYGLNVGYGNNTNPTPWATQIANATLKAFKGSPAGRVNYRAPHPCPYGAIPPAGKGSSPR